MKRMKCTYVFLLLLLVGGVSMNGQDIHFSQLSEVPMLINPANTGLFNGYHRAQMNFRTQWASAGCPYKTMHAAFDMEMFMQKHRTAYLGIGGFIYQDVAGDSRWRQMNTSLFVNGIVMVSKKSHLALGIGGGYGQNSANFAALTFGNQYDGKTFNTANNSLENVGFNQHNYIDISTGITYELTKSDVNFDHNDNFGFKVGLSAYHLNSPVLKYGGVKEAKLLPRLGFNASGELDFKGTRLTLMPSMVLFMQGPAKELNLGSYLFYNLTDETKITGFKHENRVGFAIFYRNNDAVIPMLAYEMLGFSIGLAYDINISNYNTVSRNNGGFELSLRWINLRDGLFKRGREMGTPKSGAQH